ncbi:hypothetical protein NEFER03_0415 [Nematocida sp. LUAm3]|nr:hypothetical protein NEFER03_0415 [Nematocida sp. LUAm3]KAI5175969.1 hypothetical protein NEFER02_1815 [Nematocida sp. LUAm2]KAI5179065.1 hypothetical protein NEFER01_1932 [Nematocida sp. LUAm1]
MQERTVIIRVEEVEERIQLDEYASIDDLRKIIEEKYFLQKNEYSSFLLKYMGELLSNDIPLESLFRTQDVPLIHVIPQDSLLYKKPEKNEEMKNQSMSDWQKDQDEPTSPQRETAKENLQNASGEEETKKNEEYVKIRTSSGASLSVKKNRIININGKTYVLRKKQKRKLLLFLSKLPKLSTIITYFLITALFTFYMNKIFLAILLSLTALCTLEKLKLSIGFKRGEPIKNLGKHIISFFASLFLNPGYNLTLYNN